MAKTVPVSVRLSLEDAEFIANLEVSDATTPSDKIRSIIKDAKKQKEHIVNYAGCLKIAQETLKDLTQKIKASELESKQHSELVAIFNEWIVESFAYVASAKPELDEHKLELRSFEEGVATRAFRLLEAIARMGVTTQAPCYDKNIITDNFLPILELTQIINQRLEKKEN